MLKILLLTSQKKKSKFDGLSISEETLEESLHKLIKSQ